MIKFNKNVVIAALARDCEDSLINNIPLIDHLRSKFSWSQVVVVENDSKDNTKEILFNWEKKSEGVKIISQDFGIKTIPDQTVAMASPTTSFYRIEKMSFYRNMYLDYIDTLGHDIDYLIVIDIDVKTFSVDELVNSIDQANNNWGGIFSNGVTISSYLGFKSKIYYDVFAVYEYPQKDFFSYTDESLERTFRTINKNTKKYKYHNVISAFGGIGIYKYPAIKSLRYKAIKNMFNDNEGICEHIPFNMGIIDAGYKNYISRDFFLEYGTHKFGLILKLFLHPKFFNFIYSLRGKKNR
ncbi:hypothetical protein AB3G34_00870 [Flavobacterium sp. WC2409]|uniref:Glycosyltransferase family 2 protein n=1 Tax=Flavobacterium sp. WC2409 TaxID=3234139 RepID=A0AB39W4K1_9FLAO